MRNAAAPVFCSSEPENIIQDIQNPIVNAADPNRIEYLRQSGYPSIISDFYVVLYEGFRHNVAFQQFRQIASQMESDA